MKYKYAFKLENEQSAKAVGMALGISTKHSKEICDFVRGKQAQKAIVMLENVIEKKIAVPYHRYKMDLAHKPGIGPGRYPKKASKEIIGVIKGAMANAQHKGLSVSNLYIRHICVHRASTPWRYGRHRRRKMKRSHIEVVLIEKPSEKKVTQPKETTKSVEKATKEVREDKVTQPKAKLKQTEEKPVKEVREDKK